MQPAFATAGVLCQILKLNRYTIPSFLMSLSSVYLMVLPTDVSTGIFLKLICSKIILALLQVMVHKDNVHHFFNYLNFIYS